MCAKFSNKCKKFSDIACPYAVIFLPGKLKLVSVLSVLSSITIIDNYSKKLKF